MPPPAVTYQLRVVLRETSPPIWRRILVSPSMTLDRLHDVLQAAMGWEDCHLHMFVRGEQRFTRPDPWVDDWTPPGMPKDLDERKYRITLQKILPRDPKIRLPACLSGKRACPPEDSGGSWGFEEKLEIRDDPDHEEHEWTSEWMGEDFNPEAFSVKDVNERLRHMFR